MAIDTEAARNSRNGLRFVLWLGFRLVVRIRAIQSEKVFEPHLPRSAREMARCLLGDFLDLNVHDKVLNVDIGHSRSMHATTFNSLLPF